MVGAVVDVGRFWKVLESQFLEANQRREGLRSVDATPEPARGVVGGPDEAEGTDPEVIHEDLSDEEGILISLAELITFIALAATRAAQLKGCIVIYVGDNQKCGGLVDYAPD